jgi:hypothetical protein
VDNINRNVTISLNLAGVAPISGNKKSLDKGYYQPVVTDFGTLPLTTRDGKNLTKAVFTLDFGGITRTADVFLPENEGDKLAIARWRGVAESFGYTAAVLDNGSITFNRDSFVGGTVHVYNGKRPATDGSGKEYDDIKFLTPTDWANGKRADEAVAAAGAGAAVTVNTPAAPAVAAPAVAASVTPAAPIMNGAGAAPSAANLRAALGLR